MSTTAPPEVPDRATIDDGEAIVPTPKKAAASMGGSVDSGFEHSFAAKLVPNVRKLGLLDAHDGYLRTTSGEAGLLRFEMAEGTASEYDAYDEVARDRVAAEPASL